MKIGLIQFEVSVKKNFQHVVNKVYSFLIKLKKEKCDLVSFPVVDALCQARSFENEVIVCYVNAAGRIIQDYKFDILMGRSQICVPFYGCTQKLPQNREGIIVYEVESPILKDARKAYRLFT